MLTSSEMELIEIRGRNMVCPSDYETLIWSRIYRVAINEGGVEILNISILQLSVSCK